MNQREENIERPEWVPLHIDNVRLIALDLDGTLVGPDHQTIGEVAREALAECARRGIVVVPASGRSYSLIEPLVPEIGAAQFVISSNGARVSSSSAPARHLLLRPQLATKAANRIVQVADRFRLDFEVYQAGRSYYRRDSVSSLLAGFPQGFQDYLVRNSTIVDDFAPLLARGEVEKISVAHIPGEIAGALHEELATIPNIAVASSEPTNLEVSAHGATKGHALAELADHLGIASTGVLAFGDSGNDVTMLSWAGMSVAMGNASAQARAAAEWVGPTNRDDGVGQVISALLGGDDISRFVISTARSPL